MLRSVGKATVQIPIFVATPAGDPSGFFNVSAAARVPAGCEPVNGGSL
jgi:hypothetical protein